MSAFHVQQSLELWAAAERERGHLVIGTPEYASAEAAVTAAREAYLDAIRVLAETEGSDGIHAAAVVLAVAPDELTSRVLAAAASLQRESAADQRASANDQVVSDADQRESDMDLIAVRVGRPRGDTQEESSVRRLASGAKRDATAAARDATADERDAVIDSLADVRLSHE